MLKNNSSITTTTRPLFNAWRLLDWIYPPFCCNCNIIGYELCPDCYAAIDLQANNNTCRFCGKRILEGSICKQCKHQPPLYDQLKSWAEYQGVTQQIITHIKYQHRFGLIPYLIGPLTRSIKNWNKHFDLIVPVPLGKKRLKTRGFNQACLIAKPIAVKMNIKYAPLALSRIRETRSQVGLHVTERQKNIAGAFSADQIRCKDMNILLIDDIATTGATLNECAAALKQVGAKAVFCFTVARTNYVPNINQPNLEVSI